MKIQTGYCVKHWSHSARVYDPSVCGPIRETAKEAKRDIKDKDNESVFEVHLNGLLCMFCPKEYLQTIIGSILGILLIIAYLWIAFYFRSLESPEEQQAQYDHDVEVAAESGY